MTMSAWKINALPGRITAWFLSWFLFASGITLYIYTAHKRHIENPDDKVVPTIAQLTDGFLNASLKPAEEDDGTGAGTNAGLWQRVRHSMLWHDTGASARRFHISLAILFPAAVLGLHIGVFPYIGAFFLRFILFFDKIIALSVLPILFIAFGIDELSKIMLKWRSESHPRSFSIPSISVAVCQRNRSSRASLSARVTSTLLTRWCSSRSSRAS
jgi:NitT/TauT family transport system permease protein